MHKTVKYLLCLCFIQIFLVLYYLGMRKYGININENARKHELKGMVNSKTIDYKTSTIDTYL